ncbi:MAG: undecaprenyl-diphosphate phosphatase [Candidatus Levyibacteriota bacterium]
MNLLHALLLGIVEGITEFLPVSSTGHLILAAKLLSVPQTEFVKTFEIFIQSGAILAVLMLYGKDLLKKHDLLKKVIVGFIPTGIIGLALYKVVKTYLLGNSNIVLWSLAIGGIALILIEWAIKKKKITERTVTSISYKDAVIIGIVQAISVVPGVSRSAATIFGGLVIGMDRKTAVEFSFLLAIPTMLAATGLDLAKTSYSFNASEWTALAVGFITSFVVALLAIKWLLSYIRKYSFIPFGIYRIIIAIFLAGLFFLGK